MQGSKAYFFNMIRAFQNYLDERNIPSSFIDDERSLIDFSIQNINFVFMYSAKEDPAYIRILIPNAGEADEQDIKTLKKIYNLNTTFKLGKVFIHEHQIWFTAEAFVYGRDNLNLLFDRMLSVLRDMLNSFRSNTNG